MVYTKSLIVTKHALNMMIGTFKKLFNFMKVMDLLVFHQLMYSFT